MPITEDIGAREVTLPLFPTMTEEQIGLVIKGVKRAVKKARELGGKGAGV